MSSPKFFQTLKKTANGLWSATPIIAGVILLLGLVHTFIPAKSIAGAFTKIPILDALIGALAGSVLAGNPITSYILGGELLIQGVSLIAVTAFIVAWVTVGIIQFPAEAYLLGKKFAAVRNAVSFAFAIIVATITVWLLGLL